MPYIENLIDEVNESHAGLGELVALLQIAVKAKKLVLIVSPSGCGKSTATSLIGRKIADAVLMDRLSIAGLTSLSSRFTGFQSVIVVDDIATTQTEYARTSTITTLSSLIYTHRVSSNMCGIEYEISDFYGSAVIGLQPVLLRSIIESDDWEASVQDKSIRYYHLKRPISPDITPLDVKLEQGIDIETILDFEPDNSNPLWLQLVKIGNTQWSKARTKEHLIALLKATASLQSQEIVDDSIYILLLLLLKPMSFEGIVVTKQDLEGERHLDNNALALLTEYYSYNGEFSIENVANDYRITLSQCYRIMEKQKRNWQQVSKSPTCYQPSKAMLRQLKNFELEL